MFTIEFIVGIVVLIILSIAFGGYFGLIVVGVVIVIIVLLIRNYKENKKKKLSSYICPICKTQLTHEDAVCPKCKKKAISKKMNFEDPHDILELKKKYLKGEISKEEYFREKERLEKIKFFKFYR